MRDSLIGYDNISNELIEEEHSMVTGIKLEIYY